MREGGATRGRVMAFIETMNAANGAPPSLVQVAMGVGTSKQVVWKMAQILVKEGRLKKVGRAYIPCRP